jgi:membrane associated rhomboid family serine protease
VFPLRDHDRPRTAPLVTYALIATNVVVFAHQALLGMDTPVGEAFVFRYGVVPRMLTHEVVPSSLTTPLTSMFLHGGLMHLFTNMWFLHVFGDNVEDAMGRARFLLLYLGAGVLAVGAQVLVDPDSTIPMVGASGAIAGVLGAYLRLFPRARVLSLSPLVMAVPLLIFIVSPTIELPAVFFIVIWFCFQLLSGLGSLGLSNQGGSAFFAHIGGFLAGLWLTSAIGVRKQVTQGFGPVRERFDYR